MAGLRVRVPYDPFVLNRWHPNSSLHLPSLLVCGLLPDGVMVARLTLTQLVKVRVLLGQLGISVYSVVGCTTLS